MLMVMLADADGGAGAAADGGTVSDPDVDKHKVLSGSISALDHFMQESSWEK